MPKPERINFRLDAESRKKLQNVCGITGLDEPTALRACIQAFIEHVEAHGGIWLPLAIVPKSEVKQTAHLPDFGAAPGAGAGGHSSDATRLPPIHGLNEDPPSDRPKSGGPRPRSTRGIKAIKPKSPLP